MKIAFLHFWTLRLPRGVETLTLSLANALAGRGVDVSILTSKQTRPPLVKPSPAVKIHAFPTFRYYEATTIVPFYAATLARERYDVVIAYFADFGEGPALRLAAPFARPKLLLYLTFPFESAPHRYQAYRRWGWDRSADLLLADAAYTARRGQEFFGRPVEVLPSGTDPKRFRPDADARATLRQRLGYADDDVVLLNVAALEPRKGAWRVIEALPALLARCPNVRYLVLGEGAQRPELERRVAELGLECCVRFAGTTADLPPYYNASDIFVMLPDSEAGSIACLEAMSSGLPVLVSNRGGFDETVDQRSGRAVDIDNQPAIVDALGALAGDVALRASLGAGARAVVQERFAWDRLAERLEQTCRRVAAA